MAKKAPAKKSATKKKATVKPTVKPVAKKDAKTSVKKVAKKVPLKVDTKKPAATASTLGTKTSPWTLKTPSGQSEFQAYRDEAADSPALVVLVGKTELRYQLRCIEDLHQMLKSHSDWMTLGSADEQKPAKDGTVEAWARSLQNPVGGWYGLKKGLRGRFANYVPPVLKLLGLAEVEEKPKDNRMRAL